MARDWSNAYGDAGDRIPVRDGEVWEIQVPTNGATGFVMCGDLEEGCFTSLIERVGLRPNVIVMDPPWGQALAQGFRTRACRPKPVVWETVLACIVKEALEHRPRVAFIEFGLDWFGDLDAEVARWGYRVHTIWNVVYYRTKPCLWCYVIPEDALPEESATGMKLHGLDDIKATERTIIQATRPGDIIGDPCTGQGHMCVTALENGRYFVGTELAPRRLAVTLDKCQKRGWSIRQCG